MSLLVSLSSSSMSPPGEGRPPQVYLEIAEKSNTGRVRRWSWNGWAAPPGLRLRTTGGLGVVPPGRGPMGSHWSLHRRI